MFLFSNRPGSLGLTDLWVSVARNRVRRLDGPDESGPGVNSTSGEMQPYLSADRQTLFFASNRPGGCGGFDLYITTRTRLGEKHDQ